RIVTKALRKDAGERYQVVEDMQCDLQLTTSCADHLHAAGRYDEAIEQRRKVMELNPNDAQPARSTQQ
ncbi:MAG TPA: hypothetical protein VFS77_06295, partial [Pyrinomonadaceae bacterium]|nr:hypothetical protein [Pyrinomonadaceae bacterium]